MMNFKSIFSVFTASMLCLGVCTAATPKKETKSKSPITIGLSPSDYLQHLNEIRREHFRRAYNGYHNGE